ncbi:hypothetical protein H4582DRAFT_1958750 [Lactarius indigo]|nr:hypothetical protein H4582DRAFT_1958750 [Lactarius indigo]
MSSRSSSYSSIGDHSVSSPIIIELGSSIGNPSSDPPSPPNDSPTGTTSHNPHRSQEVGNITQILFEKLEEAQAQGKGYGHAINTLPDNVLLEIFDFCRKGHDAGWFTFALVQVCQRWRQVVFGSAHRLDVQLLCTHGTPVMTHLNFWPPLPIVIHYDSTDCFTLGDKDNLFAALEHRDRISRVDLCLTRSQLGEVATAMQVPFPALTHLGLRWEDEPPTIPSGFLGGFAPRLQHLDLEGVLIPSLPTLLSSTGDLVKLSLDDITQDAYISPEAMAAGLAALPRLKHLFIGLRSGTSHPDQMRPPPAKRVLVPSLDFFEFHGTSGYLEDLVARMVCPQLDQFCIKYSNRLLDFHAVQLFKFFDCSEDPNLTPIRQADVSFSRDFVTFRIYPCPENRPNRRPNPSHVYAWIHCQGVERQVSHVAQVFSQRSTMLSRVLHFKLSRYRDDAGRHEWLNLLRQFSAARTLHPHRGDGRRSVASPRLDILRRPAVISP